MTYGIVIRFVIDGGQALDSPIEKSKDYEDTALDCGNNVDTLTRLLHRESIGSPLYQIVSTRRDLAIAVDLLVRFCKSSSLVHWNVITHVLKYIKGTVKLGL